MNIRGHFAEIANLKRQDALKKVERRKRNGLKLKQHALHPTSFT